MKKMTLWMVAFAVLAGSALHAQDITGTWQGTLQAGKALRLVVKISKADSGTLNAKFYSIDQNGQAFNAGPITVQSGTVKIEIPIIAGSYEGKLNADNTTITGTWNQGGTPLPLVLQHVTDAAAWEIPVPVPVKQMPENADPSFDVATIKPNNSGVAALQGLTMNGRHFVTRNSSLGDLISFAYDVQAKQIIGAPDWISKDRYDIDAVPDVEGAPSTLQLRVMVQKLVADRFKLAFHHDKKELSAFVLTVGKNGQKLTPTQLTGSTLPGIGFRPTAGGLTMNVMNGSMVTFAAVLQMVVLDRPVVDQTGITGKFDFNVTFMPDDSQFNGRPMRLPASDSVEAAPNLFDAVQQQLGLKLTAEKTAVDVLVIDHVEKPSAN